MSASRLTTVITVFAAALALWSVVALERVRAPVDIDRVMLGETPATFYTAGAAQGPLVVVAHGFGGSRQMMEAISLTLARAGHTVVAFDFIGHGRHPAALSPAIDTLTGTTEDLVRQTLFVVAQARQRTGLSEVSLVGHSMATDVIVRAAQRLEQTASVVAISMYSDAVTPTHPERLLVISGAFETALRAVALDTLAQIGPATEGETTTTGEITRRAVSAPWVGHVGVLWSSLTLSETANWLGQEAAPVKTGVWILTLLASILFLFRPLVRILPATASPEATGLGRATIAAVAGSALAGCVAVTGLPLNGLAGFGGLGLAFGAWGIVVLLILRVPVRPERRDLVAAILLVGWGLGVFAFALDRYGAAFVPTGPRLSLALLLLPATLIFGLADRYLVQGRGVIARIILRVPFLVALTVAMVVSPAQLGLVFTVLPVMVLYWLVYGTMAMWLARRSGPVGAGLGAGVILAWAIAASTPLFLG